MTGQVVLAIEDMMKTENEEVIVESILSDDNMIMMLRDSVMTLKKAIIKSREETDREIKALRQELKEEKMECKNCEKKMKGKEVEKKKKK